MQHFLGASIRALKGGDRGRKSENECSGSNSQKKNEKSLSSIFVDLHIRTGEPESGDTQTFIVRVHGKFNRQILYP